MIEDKIQEKAQAAIQKVRDELEKVYAEAFDDLLADYQRFTLKVGTVCVLVGILIGIGMATLIEVVFGG